VEHARIAQILRSGGLDLPPGAAVDVTGEDPVLAALPGGGSCRPPGALDILT